MVHIVIHDYVNVHVVGDIGQYKPWPTKFVIGSHDKLPNKAGHTYYKYDVYHIKLITHLIFLYTQRCHSV